MRIVAIADIVMSLDNVIAIAAAAETRRGTVDIAHAAPIKTTLIIFGLATSVPLIIAGSALLMALLDRFPILVWAGAALLGWVAGEIMIKDPALWRTGARSRTDCRPLAYLGGRAGAVFVVALGWMHRAHPAQARAGAAADHRTRRGRKSFRRARIRSDRHDWAR